MVDTFQVGLAVMLWPRTLFGLLFDCRAVSAGWIRVMGVLAATFGIYYLGTAFGDQRCALIEDGPHTLCWRVREGASQAVATLAFKHVSPVLHRLLALALALFHNIQHRCFDEERITIFTWSG
jgi:hypothetical protein